MLKNAVKLVGSISKASKTKAIPDVLKAGSETIGLVNKVAKKKKKEDNKRKKTVVR